MVQVLGTGAEVEESQAYEEARSILGSIVSKLISIAQTVIHWVMSVARQFITYTSENPLAVVLLVCNACIWLA